MLTQIVHANIVLPDKVLYNGCCCLKDGVIHHIGDQPFSTDCAVIDAQGCWLLPGFIDIHCHGGAGHDFMDASTSEMQSISRFHLAHGTTTLLATTMTGTWGEITGALDHIADLINSDRQLTIHGVHLEGPWLNPKQCGAQDISCMDLPSTEKMDALLKKYPFIERISAAPELPGGLAVGLAGKDRGIVMSVAHTDADFEVVEEAADHGYSLMTHLYSGMKLTERVDLYRVAGAVEAGLYDDRLYVELIADGKHLPDSLLKLIYKCKGTERICLITDATRGAGLPEGTNTRLRKCATSSELVIEDGVAKLADRTAFAGSVATTDRLLRVMHLHAGISLPEVSRMLSAVPAKIMGYQDRGSITIGKRADLVLLNQAFSVKSVILGGEIYES